MKEKKDDVKKLDVDELKEISGGSEEEPVNMQHEIQPKYGIIRPRPIVKYGVFGPVKPGSKSDIQPHDKKPGTGGVMSKDNDK